MDVGVWSRIGPSEFKIEGTLKSWSVKGKLNKVNVPTLLINGADDEAGDVCVSPFKDGIREGLVEWVTFGNSSHMPFWEEEDKYLKLVSDFLKR